MILLYFLYNLKTSKLKCFSGEEIMAWSITEIREEFKKQKHSLAKWNKTFLLERMWSYKTDHTETASLHWRDFRFDDQQKGNVSNDFLAVSPLPKGDYRHTVKIWMQVLQVGSNHQNISGPRSQNHVEVSEILPREPTFKGYKNCHSLFKKSGAKFSPPFLLQ